MLRTNYARALLCAVAAVLVFMPSLSGIGAVARAADLGNVEGCRSWSASRWTQELHSVLKSAPKDVGWDRLKVMMTDPSCKRGLAQHGLTPCIQKLGKMSEEHQLSFAGGAGTDIPEKLYYKAAEQAFPGIWELPSKLREGGIPSDWVSFCRDNGYICGGKKDPATPDYHFVMHIPRAPDKGQKYDQWLNVRVNNAKGNPNPVLVDLISIVQWQESDGGKRFMPFFGARFTKGFGVPITSAPGPAGRCLSCHGSGFVKPFRTWTAADLKGWPNRGETSRRNHDAEIKAYGQVAWNPRPERPSAFFPRSGVYHPERMGPVPYTSKVDCAFCHNGKTRGLVNLTNWGTAAHLVEDRISDGSMPKEAQFYSGADRVQLRTELYGMYPDQVWNWLGLDQCKTQK